MSDDRNLLFGVMAVQLKFITPRALMEAAASWAVNRELSLRDYLLERRLISEKVADMIEGLLSEQVAAHQGDVRATLQSFGGDRAVHESFAASAVLIRDEEGPGLDSFGGEAAPKPSVSEPAKSEPGGGDEVLEDAERLTLEHPGRYTVRSEHSRGGIGRVLLATDAHIGREIAVKELLADPAEGTPSLDSGSRKTTAVMSRFLREARITGQLEHPAIVPVYELGRRSDGTIYYTMKFVRGKTLAQAIEGSRDLSARLKLLTHFHDLCNAIAYAHSRQVIHRDIKPQNVMVGEFGETVVLDWGLAKVKGKTDKRARTMERELKLFREAGALETIKGTPLGTPAYMSPEQAEGRLDAVDERSDIWSLGALLYEIITGKIPFEGVNAYEIMGRVIKDDPRPVTELEPLVPEELSAIVMKCLHKDPAGRYQKAEDLAEDIEAYLTGRLVSAFQYSALALFRRWLKRWWPVAVTAAAGILVLIVVFTWSYLHIREEKDRALYNISEAYFAYGRWAEAENRWGAAEVCYARSLLMTDRERTRYALDYAHTAPSIPARLKYFMEGGGAKLTDLVESPDGTLLAAGGDDGKVRLWDLQSGKLKALLEGHQGAVNGLGFSADGRLLASAGEDSSVRLWDTTTGRLLHAMRDTGDSFWLVAFNPDSSLLAAAGEEPVVVVFDTGTGEEKLRLTGHARRVWALAFSPDGGRLMSASKDRKIIIWDMPRGGKRLVLEGHESSILTAAFSPSGERLVSGDWHGEVRGWDLRRGAMQFIHPGPGPARQLIISPDGLRALVGYDSGEIELINLVNGITEKTIRAHEGQLFDLKPLSGFGRFASCGGDHMVRLWSMDEDAPANVIQAQASRVKRIAYSPESGLLATGGEEGDVRVWSLDGRDTVTRVASLSGRVLDMAVSAKADLAAVCGVNPEIPVVDLGGGKVLRTLSGHEKRVAAAVFSSDGSRLVTGSWDNTVGVWDPKSGELVHRLTGHTGRVWAVALTPDDRLIVSSGDDGVVRVWSMATGGLLYELSGHQGWVHYLAMSPDGKLLASGGEDKVVRVWNLENGELAHEFAGHEDGIYSLAISPDGKLLASGSADNTIRIWDLGSGKLLHVLTGHTFWVLGLEFSGDGGFLVSRGYDDTVRIWDPVAGKEVLMLPKSTDELRCIAVRPDFSLVATGARDRTIRLYDPATGRLLQVLRGHPGSIERLSFIGQKELVSVDHRGNLFVWPFLEKYFRDAPADLYEGAEDETGLTLDGMEVVPFLPGGAGQQ